jgi:hypothetical protein
VFLRTIKRAGTYPAIIVEKISNAILIDVPKKGATSIPSLNGKLIG